MNAWPFLLAQNDGGGAAAGMIGILFTLICNCIIPLALYAVTAIGLGKLFEKAGRPAWAGWVPIYNAYVITEISGREILWFILLIVPCVNIVAAILICIDFVKAYGKDAGWGVGLALLPYIFAPLLGFSNVQYVGPAPKQM